MKMKTIIIGLYALLCPIFIWAQQPSYDIVNAGTGKDGNYLVMVSLVMTKTDGARDMLKYCAVHGVIFKGVAGNDGDGMDHKALIKDPSVEQTKADFFKTFFGNKEYERYVSLIDSSYRCVKEKRKDYLVSATLMVHKESLLKYLEDSGIVKGFSSLW